MKFREIVLLLNTDDFWITIDEDIETTVHIEGSTKETYQALGKFLAYTVKRITPVNNGIELILAVSNGQTGRKETL